MIGLVLKRSHKTEREYHDLCGEEGILDKYGLRIPAS